jgi:NADP-dependent 3-hydroxy acid dehydrogenase YdfG
LKGQVAVITGATSGIGRGVAENLHEAGMRLVLTGRRKERLEELSSRLSGAVLVPGDINDPALPQRLIDTAVERFGQCDVVFNGAGIMHAGPVADVDIDKLCEMIRVNVESGTRLAYVAAKHFVKVGGGHLINVSSILGTKVRPNAGAYAGTKYAIEALSEALRMELAKTNVKVSVIEPGVVNTELQDHFAVHPRQALGITQALEPSDIARCVRCLLEQPPHVRIPVMLVLPGEQPMEDRRTSTQLPFSLLFMVVGAPCISWD